MASNQYSYLNYEGLSLLWNKITKIIKDSVLELNRRVTLIENGEIGAPFFKSFATLAEYETAVANKEVVYPCVSYITEDSVIKFEKLVLTNKAIVTVTQPLIDQIAHSDVKPLTFNPEYYEIFEVNGEDCLSNIVKYENYNVIPFPSFNLDDTFNIKFKLKDKPQYFIEDCKDDMLKALFYCNLSYFEIDESFYNRVPNKSSNGSVIEYSVGFLMPSVGPNFTCKFKGNYGITDKSLSLNTLSEFIYGLAAVAGNYTSTQFYGKLQIPRGNETYGNPSDMYNIDTETGATFCGMVNFIAQQYNTPYNNLHIIIETY